MTDPIEREALAKAMHAERLEHEGCRSGYADEQWQESKAVRERWLATADVALRAIPSARVGGGEEEFVKALDEYINFRDAVLYDEGIDGDCKLDATRIDVLRRRVLDLYRAAAPVALKINYEAAIDEMSRQVAEFARLVNGPGVGDYEFDARKIVDAAVIALHKGE